MPQEDRKDFSEWNVHRKYIEQEGVCSNPMCQNSIVTGYHRHHKNGNHSNNTYDNLQLLCVECHNAVKSKEDKVDNPWLAHKAVEREVFQQLDVMVKMALDNKVSGANMERIVEAEQLKLKISREEKGINDSTEYPPATIKLITSYEENNKMVEQYMQGYTDCMKKLMEKKLE